MKDALYVGLACLGLWACASTTSEAPATEVPRAPSPVSPSPVQQPVQQEEQVRDDGAKATAEQWAEQKIAAEIETTKKESSPVAQGDAFDPLAISSELEEASIPTTEMTPSNQLRPKTPNELNAAIGVVTSESSVEGAAKKLTARLGKPSWTESSKGSDKAKRRVWVASHGDRCHRLVLEADGSVEVESASKSEWRLLSAMARQNPCTGEIKRGMSDK